MLSHRKILSMQDPLFKKVWEIYNQSFTYEEVRSLDAQKPLFNHPAYTLWVWEDSGEVIGFISAWHYPRFTYLEHIAVNSQKRSSGYGHTMMKEWLELRTMPVILEIDPVVDDSTKRRCDFYKSLGFVLDEKIREQPNYSNGITTITMELMFYPEMLDESTIDEFQWIHHTEIVQSIRDSCQKNQKRLAASRSRFISQIS